VRPIYSCSATMLATLAGAALLQPQMMKAGSLHIRKRI
jgi:hypothetical protein